MSVISYTVIIGQYDTLRPTKWPSVCLTDIANQHSASGWRVRRIPVRHENNRRASRHPKMLPHIYFTKAEYTLYMDGNIKLLKDPNTFVPGLLKKHDMALFVHPQRTCLYAEAKICLRHKKANAKLVNKQIARYEKLGFPEDFGLTACWVIACRNTAQVRLLGKLWWQEYQKYSCRDQLSFDFIRWKLGVEYAEIPGNLFYGGSDYFERGSHA